MRRKFKNIPTVLDGIRFDSKLEARRYGELKLLQMAGEISHLECHPSLPITINGIKICTAVADFSYFDKGERVFEDTKGFHTPLSKLKMKLVRASYPGIDWRIVN